uniref:Post-GPI attachment to proteins factor 3 n=1 Tax=Macrostomum lignano TaxID=282301 RepID=A0A1I8GGW3_9PLAT
MAPLLLSKSSIPFVATLLVLIGLPCLQVGLVYKQFWYSDLAMATQQRLSNCSCSCYDGFLEGRAYYTLGRPHFYSSAYRHVYINGDPQSAVLLALLSCSVLLVYKAIESVWRLAAWRPNLIVALVANLLVAYDLFWSTFQYGR